MADKPHGPQRDSMTAPQRIFWEMMTDQRVANLMLAADFIGDLDADTLTLIRYLGREDAKPVRDFIFEAKPETLQFLSDLRKKEVEDIAGAIEVGLALRRAFRFFKYGIATAFAVFVGMSLIWDKIKALYPGATTAK